MGEKGEPDAEDMIVAVLAGVHDPQIRMEFIEHFESSLQDFEKQMGEAYRKWQKLDSTIKGSVERAHISSLVFGIINNQVISMKLLLMGLIIPAGNTQRQVLEGIALVLLASRRDIGLRQKYMEGTLSTNKAITYIKRHAIKLSLVPEAVAQLEQSSKFYDQFSHPTMMTVAHSIFLNPTGSAVLGGFFDRGKMEMYEKEVQSRVSLASTFCNLMDAIDHNLLQDGA